MAYKRLKQCQNQAVTPTNIVRFTHANLDPTLHFIHKASPCLLSSIADLPTQIKLTFLLRYVDKKNYSQISEEQGISRHCVERNLVIALSQLKKSVLADVK